MGLHIGVLHAKKLLRLLAGVVFDLVHVVTAGIETGENKTLGVLVREQVAHGELRGQGAVVLTGDELQVAALVGQFLDDRARETRGHLAVSVRLAK